MPTVKDEKGEVVAKMDYTPEGEMQAEKWFKIMLVIQL